MRELSGKRFRRKDDVGAEPAIYEAYIARGNERLRTHCHKGNGVVVEVESDTSPRAGLVVVHPVGGIGDLAMDARTFHDDYVEVEVPKPQKEGGGKKGDAAGDRDKA